MTEPRDSSMAHQSELMSSTGTRDSRRESERQSRFKKPLPEHLF